MAWASTQRVQHYSVYRKRLLDYNEHVSLLPADSSAFIRLFISANMHPPSCCSSAIVGVARRRVFLRERHLNLCFSPRSAEADSQRLQGLIDGNKKWLEMRKKDASTYPSVALVHVKVV